MWNNFHNDITLRYSCVFDKWKNTILKTLHNVDITLIETSSFISVDVGLYKTSVYFRANSKFADISIGRCWFWRISHLRFHYFPSFFLAAVKLFDFTPVVRFYIHTCGVHFLYFSINKWITIASLLRVA